MKKLIAILLLAGMGLACLVSCAGSDPKLPEPDDGTLTQPAGTEEETGEETEKETGAANLLDFIKDGSVNCQVIYSLSDGGAESTAYSIATSLKNAFGVKTISVKRDGAVTYDPNALEILIGKTNRPESASAGQDASREKDYVVGVYGKKLVIFGNTPEMLEKAKTLFNTLCVTGKTDLSVKEDFMSLRLGAYALLPGTVGNKVISEFSIVYPKDSYNGEMYAALTLQQWIYEKGGYFLPLKDDTKAASDCEILVGKTNRTTLSLPGANAFRVDVKGTKVEAVASDLNGYIALASALQSKVFKVGPKFALTDGTVAEGTSTKPIDNGRKGTYRVIWQNIWFHDAVPEINNGQKTFGINTVNYLISHIKSYDPDVVGFNEFYDQWRTMTDMVAAMASLGYTEARPDGRDYTVPIFYKTDKLNLLEVKWYSAGEITYTNGGANFTVNHAADTRWRGVMIAAFEDKVTKDKFLVACTHLESNWAVVNQSPDNGDPVREEEVSTSILPGLVDMQEKWGGIPIMMGGDYNSVSTRIACKLLENAGFLNAHNHAEIKNDICSCHGYPGYSIKFNAFITPASVGSGYTGGIDQIYARGEDLVMKQFRTMDDLLPRYISDHCPVMLDFDLKNN